LKILVTGTAGFIGYHVANGLLERGDEVVGLDSINDYYDVRLKYARLADAGIARDAIGDGAPVASRRHPRYRFVRLDLADRERFHALFAAERFDAVCHLAAQAGVRYSVTNPEVYAQSNVVGFLNVLEGCRRTGVTNLCYASSSSVYGLNATYPFSTHAGADHPVSLYAATKKANELMAHCYSHLYGIRATGLRFFTVYGPWGRPDMAPIKFVEAILGGRPIDVYGNGEMKRDFTYVDDIAAGVIRVIDKPATPMPGWSAERPDPAGSSAPHRVYNIGRGSPVELMSFIAAIEKSLGREAVKRFLPMQQGDVAITSADVSDLEEDLGYRPSVSVVDGVERFVRWYRDKYVPLLSPAGGPA
jgi:UDP-glucuronate 4-epimerase